MFAEELPCVRWRGTIVCHRIALLSLFLKPRVDAALEGAKIRSFLGDVHGLEPQLFQVPWFQGRSDSDEDRKLIRFGADGDCLAAVIGLLRIPGIAPAA